MKIFFGLLCIVVGAAIVWKTEAILGFVGRVDWAEEYLHLYGGSRLFFKLIGLLLIIIGMLMVTGLGGAAAETILKPLFGMR